MTDTIYTVRDKHTWEPLATYTDRAACWAEWFTRDGRLWVPKGAIVVTGPDDLRVYLEGQGT